MWNSQSVNYTGNLIMRCSKYDNRQIYYLDSINIWEYADYFIVIYYKRCYGVAVEFVCQEK